MDPTPIGEDTALSSYPISHTGPVGHAEINTAPSSSPINPLPTIHLSNSPDGNVTPLRRANTNESMPSAPTLPVPKKHKNRKKRANIRIATLNMNGRGAQESESLQKGKWPEMGRLMHSNDLAIIALQETHLSKPLTENIHDFYKDKGLVIVNSSLSDTSRATSSAGVAIVINKAKLSTENIITYELIPGRALLVRIKWSEPNPTSGDDGFLTLLNIYAPSDSPTSRAAFFNQLNEISWGAGQNQKPKPDILLGDFNMVEDELDRLPCRPDRECEREALSNLTKEKLTLSDAWRRDHPHMLTYTWSNSDSASRIDRIYTNERLNQSTFDWKITPPGPFLSDHNLVTTRLARPQTVPIGENRWAMPSSLMEDEKFKLKAEELGIKINKTLQNFELSHPNEESETETQRIFKNFKNAIIAAAKEHMLLQIGKVQSAIKTLEKDIKSTEQNTNIAPKERILKLKNLKEKLISLKLTRARKSKLTGQVKYRLEGESLSSKYWSSTIKDKKPRDTIPFLYKPSLRQSDNDPKPIERDSQEMANIAGKYHSESQKIDDGLTEEETRQAQEKSIGLLNKTLTTEQKEKLEAKISEEDVEEAIKLAKTGTAPGLDGITTEFWKSLLNLQKERIKAEKPYFDISGLIAKTFCSIAKHGIVKGTDFSAGWMCPIFKKGDRAEIANYRPISVLNTDHKLMTKILSTRLAEVVPEIIHTDQAGFMKNRSIYNQVHLTDLIVNAGNILGINGAVIALDQEKAYDKIDHSYLWQVMHKVGIPEYFISTVQHIYSDAKTTVVINGYQSNPYKVTRGVRQGCPLSCLLFNLAIEPLAEMIRQSQLKGFVAKDEISSINSKISMYADDTTVLLSEDDNFETLDNLLKIWCQGAKAKFNINKTEILPFGTKDYRTYLVENRRLNPTSKEFPPNAKIAKDGTSIHILGAWLGNNVDPIVAWSTTVDKVEHRIKTWEKCNPTLEGRRLIHQITIGGGTQFLAKMQGVPPNIKERLEKLQRNHIKKDGTHNISLKILRSKFELGGKQLIDIEARDEAISLMRLKDFLAAPKRRPKWALIADILLRIDITKSLESRNPLTLISPFTQTWDSRKMGSILPKILSDMIKAARKYNVRIAADESALTRSALITLPVWDHQRATGRRTELYNSISEKCLTTVHKTRTCGEATAVSARLKDPAHRRRRNCTCNACHADKINGCEKPHNCAKQADTLLSYIPLAWNPSNYPETMTEEYEQTLIDKLSPGDAITISKNTRPVVLPSDLVRVFSHPAQKEKEMLHTTRNLIQIPAKNTRILMKANGNGFQFDLWQKIIVVIEAFCKGSHRNAPAGVGLRYGQNDPRNIAIRIDGGTKTTHSRTLLLGIAYILQSNAKSLDIEIHTAHRTLITLLTEKIHDWEDIGWEGVKDQDVLKKIISQIRSRLSNTRLVLIDRLHRDWLPAFEDAKRAAYLNIEDKTEIPLNTSAKSILPL